jgi:hypothetical protein
MVGLCLASCRRLDCSAHAELLPRSTIGKLRVRPSIFLVLFHKVPWAQVIKPLSPSLVELPRTHFLSRRASCPAAYSLPAAPAHSPERLLPLEISILRFPFRIRADMPSRSLCRSQFRTVRLRVRAEATPEQATRLQNLPFRICSVRTAGANTDKVRLTSWTVLPHRAMESPSL